MTYALYLDDLVSGRGSARARFEESLKPAEPEPKPTAAKVTERWGMGKQAYEQQQAALRMLAGGG